MRRMMNLKKKKRLKTWLEKEMGRIVFLGISLIKIDHLARFGTFSLLSS